MNIRYTLVSLLCMICASFPVQSTETAPETTLHMQPTANEADAGPMLRALIAQAAAATSPTTISIPKSTYHFYPESAPEQKLYISNHDQQAVHRVAIPLQNLKNVQLDGNGSTFVFHGLILPFLLQDCENVRLAGIHIAVDSPLAREGRIVDISEAGITLQFPTHPKWHVENGTFWMQGRDWKQRPNHALGFNPDGTMLAHGQGGDMPWSTVAEQVSENCVRFSSNRPLQKYNLAPGATLVLRSYWRPHPAMVLYRAKDTVLKDVVFHDSLGMALIAQRSENIRIQGGGCIRAQDRMHTAGADATHFSNCRGLIHVENATYEGMMDDAINVHATCPAITQVHSPTEVTARFMHSQAYGFDIAAPGERLRFIHGKTLENTQTTCRVKHIEKIDAQHIRLTLEKPLAEGIGVGDAIENDDWHPEVIFRRNIVRHNRARGALFTTPRRVLVEHNHFDHSSGSAILLAGDAQGWYESGRCLDVCIRHNLFTHNLTALYQFTHAIISVCPEVREPAKQKTQYHDNVRIEDNTFITHRVPLLYAISASNLSFRNNTIIFNNRYPATSKPQPFITEYCNGLQIETPILQNP